MSDPELWRWVWLAAAVGFALGEMAVAGSFFLLPFAAGALLAAVGAFAGLPVALEWLAFVAGSAAAFASMVPLRRRLDSRGSGSGVGAQRWVGREGHVVRAIPGAGHVGTVRLEREEWRAESLTGAPIPEGSTVMVSRVEGARLVVVPLEIPLEIPSIERGED